MIIYLKRLKSSKFVRVKAFPMYGGIGVSAPSLHRESTDSLIRPLFEKQSDCICNKMAIGIVIIHFSVTVTCGIAAGVITGIVWLSSSAHSDMV